MAVHPALEPAEHPGTDEWSELKQQRLTQAQRRQLQLEQENEDWCSSQYPYRKS